MIAQELEVSLHMAFVDARQQRHEFITVEHLLMALLDNPSEGRIDPFVGRSNEVERTIQVLARRRKNNPMLIGDAGVGKTALRSSRASPAASSRKGEVP
jgi:ATP-dependent Clp protease ATP-binding subunit ClpA